MSLRSLVGSLPDLTRLVSREPTTHATRDSEWICSFAMAAWPVALAMPGNSFLNPVFAVLRSYGVTEALCATVLALIVAGRLVALAVNGRSPRTPLLREIGAVLGLIVWLQLGVVILVGSERSFGAVPPVSLVYFVLAIAEFRSLLRASFDVRYG